MTNSQLINYRSRYHGTRTQYRHGWWLNRLPAHIRGPFWDRLQLIAPRQLWLSKTFKVSRKLRNKQLLKIYQLVNNLLSRIEHYLRDLRSWMLICLKRMARFWIKITPRQQASRTVRSEDHSLFKRVSFWKWSRSTKLWTLISLHPTLPTTKKSVCSQKETTSKNPKATRDWATGQKVQFSASASSLRTQTHPFLLKNRNKMKIKILKIQIRHRPEAVLTWTI